MPHCFRRVNGLAVALLVLAISSCASRAPRVCPDGMEKDDRRSVEGKELFCRSPDGKRVRWNDFHANGKRRQICAFNQGKPEGTFLAWYADGKQWLEGVYKDGKRIGKWTQWGQTGAVVAKGEYRDGQFIAGAPVGVAALCDGVKP